MWHLAKRLLIAVSLLWLGAQPGQTQAADPTERRVGLVIGNAEYKAGALTTAANDAGLVAQTLQAAGFDVVGARDLDGDALRATFRDFADKVATSGPDTIAFIYLAGHGLQFEGENFFVPVDARIERDLDVPIQALRLNDYLRPIAALKTKGVVVVMDMARANPFAKSGQPLAGGLALVEPTPGVLIAFNAAPGTLAPASAPPYGVYAQSLAEMIREGGLPLNGVFDRVRLRVNDLSRGAAVPWHASQIKTQFEFFERATDAPRTEASYQATSARRERPIREFGAQDAYLAALERDTLQGYLDFLDAYPKEPISKRVRAIVAARREAITWRRARQADTPEAYWTYLDRYPRGPHAHDARRRLAYLTAPAEPPRVYTSYDYGLPPPPREEIVYIERPAMVFDDPVYFFAPPPPPPIYYLPPPPPPYYFAPPPPPVEIYVLPVPLFIAIPLFVRAPRYVAPPPNNVIFQNIHRTTVINNTTNIVNAPATPAANATPPGGPQTAGQPATGPAPQVQKGLSSGAAGTAAVVGAGALVGAAALNSPKVSLPASLAAKASTTPVSPGAPGQAVLKGPATGQQPLGQQQQGKTVPTGLKPPTGPSGAPGLPQPQNRALPGAPSAQPLPQVPGQPLAKQTVPGQPTILNQPAGQPTAKSGAPGAPRQPAQVTPTAPVQPRSATVTPPVTGSQTAKPLPGLVAPGSPGQTPAQPTGKPPALTAGTPQPGQPRPSVGPAGTSGKPLPAPPPAAVVPPPAPRQQRIERAQEDRGRIENQLQQDRQRQLDKRRQEEAAQSRGRDEQLRQRQQQAEQQRRAMDQQRLQQQQQQASQAAARAAQQAQQQQAAQRAAQQQQQQQAAQAAAARAAQQQAAQQAAARAAAQNNQKKCGVPGTPPCPR